MTAHRSARDEILGRVRSALAGVEPTPEPVVAPRAVHDPPRSHAQVVDLFAERVADYRAAVDRVAPADLARRVVVPSGLDGVLRAAVSHPVVDEELSAAELDTVDAVLTTACVGIAETGTIVLDHGPGQGRRALTLVPDRHVCVVHADQVVPNVPDAMARLATSVARGRPLTWVSGPSATSDIELTRVEGVHGPRVLHVVLVG